ncbi:MAG TPA: UDP-N-acetylglucosamine--N-acetylmuramyl-(pentapeptide) pyrophosphoryl-undecaprenol N-acetylglucosamine transferase [Solirubrobacterales bacterium]|nr:UDP-N-acetylglucosamine--N-acetylmuramyl-(pentapeptide) pyrophosphoryl-undecaprenol N-acetylglucosamine transferase [Solirubrobacterales bacterium]
MAVADELRDRGATVTFMGARGRVEADLVPGGGYEIDLLDLSGIDRKNPIKAARAAFQAAAAMPKARRLLADRGAQVVMGGGGFVAGPAGLAARTKGIPLVLTEADRHLGLANRLLARRAERVCLAFAIDGMDGENVMVTGRPVNREVLSADRGEARRRFGIDPDARALLVMGGSLGARTINFAALEAFAERDGREFDVIHVSGRRDFAELRSRLDEAAFAAGYTLIEYEPDMGDGLAACDLVLGRSGGSIFELTAVGRPAILIPYPYATADHQTANAAWMVEAGAAEVIGDVDLSADLIAERVPRLLADGERITAMSRASASLAKPNAAAEIADQVWAAAGGTE